MSTFFYKHLSMNHKWQLTKSISPYFVLIAFLFFHINSLLPQSSYSLNAPFVYDFSDAHIQTLGNNTYWFFQALPSGEPLTGHPIIRITEFDICGPTRAVEFTHPSISGVSDFKQSFVDGDTVRISVRNNPRDLHPSSEIGLLSVDISTFEHRYQYIRADNVIIPKAFSLTNDGHYIVHSFLSYTDRPPQYCSFLLDKGFNILAYYENFSEWTATGNGIALLDDGYMLATSENIYKVDLELQPVWRKTFPATRYTGGFVKQADGVVIYVVQPPNPNEIVLIKLGFNGNLIWQTDNLNFNGLRSRHFKLVENSDGNLAFAVFTSDSNNLFTDQLNIYTIDAKSGNVITAKNTFDHPLMDEFRLVHFSLDSEDNIQLISRTVDNQFLLWNAVDGLACDLFDGYPNTSPSSPLELTSANMPNSINDYFQTGSYDWTKMDVPPNAELICENILPLNDQLPSDTSACLENGLTLDISNIPYDIIWEDGSTEKIRPVATAGLYSYQIDHCDIVFSENIYVDFEKCNCQFYVPDVFSPNDDGINDHFKLYNPCDYLTFFEIKIFNRWGGLLFTSKDQLFTWDGTFKNQKVQPGVFTFFIKHKSSFDDNMQTIEGAFTILK